MKPYPLVFEPILLEKVWGGRRLERFGKRLPPGKLIGESWEVADMPATSASGAGGAAARSVIGAGALRGRTLGDAMALWGDELLGGAPAGSGFPLLIKLLDASQDLSVQVHPSPAYAAANTGAHLKSECWYVLEALPGSLIYKGVRPGVDRAAFERALGEGRGEGVVGLLEAVPAVPGECHNLPSGTVHALGAGVLVAEVQTPSDTTFRVYDWGRQGRELHVRQALECIDFGPAPAATRATGGASRLAATEFYTIDELRPTSGAASISSEPGGILLMAVAGSSRIESSDGSFAPVALPMGTTVLVPSACAPAARISGSAGVRVLRVTLGGR